MDKITAQHLQVLMDRDWEAATSIIDDLVKWGLWSNKHHMPNKKGRQLVGELVSYARCLLKQKG